MMESLIATSSFINNNDTATTTTATTTAICWLIGIVFMILAAIYSNLTEALPFHLNFIQTKSIYDDDDTTKNNNVSPGLYFTLMTIFGIWWWTMGMCLFIVASSSSSSEELISSSLSESNDFDAHVLAAIVIAALVPLILIMIQIYRNSNPEGSRPPFLVVVMLACALVFATPTQVWRDPIWKFGLPSWIAIMIGAYRIPTRATAKRRKQQ